MSSIMAGLALLVSCMVLIQSTTAHDAAVRALLQQLAQPQVGGGIPDPVAYFPLLDGSLYAALPVPGAFAGVGQAISWSEPDALFGSTLVCNRSQQSHVTIPGVVYGQRGPFAISFWAKMQPEDGESMEYMYSHNSTTTPIQAVGSNQVNMYVPQQGHSSFGVVRTIVQDGNDARTNGSLPFFLDSDGCVSNPNCPTANRNITMFQGRSVPDWHLLTLTTHPQGGRGFQLYIDGQLAAEVLQDETYIDAEGFVKVASGGDPLDLDGDIVLCGRADLNADRFFSGALAHLMVFDSALDPEQVLAIYQQARGDSFTVTLPQNPVVAPAQEQTPPSQGQVRPAADCMTGCVDFNGSYACATSQGEMRQCTVVPAEPPRTEDDGPEAAGGTAGGERVTPAPDCNTPCEEFNGAYTCTTPEGQLRQCAVSPVGGELMSVAQPGVDTAAATPPQGEVAPHPDCNTPCEEFNGVYTCTTPEGQLRQCSASAGGVLQAAATPVEGCITECTDYNGAQMCETEAGLLRMCTEGGTQSDPPSLITPQRPAAEQDAQPAPAQLAAQQQAATLGGLPLCSSKPIEGLNTLSECPEGSMCAALSRQQIATTFGGILDLQPGAVGVCAYAPNNMMLPNSTVVPPAMAFFPLSGQTLDSFPLPEYSGVAQGAGLETDPLFGYALRCRQSDQDLVALDPVQYARSGAFTINLWFKPEDMSGNMLSYIYSHQEAQAEGNQSAWGPNQIHVYMPQQSHVDFGVVRAIVKDNSDMDMGSSSQVYLDSDGTVSYTGLRPLPGPILDEEWHMVTVSSQPASGQGFRLYIDGQLAGELQGNTSYTNPAGIPLDVSGGDPMLLSSNVVLCSRADASSVRHFDGKLAHLGLYDVSLTGEQVGELYKAVDNRRVLLGEGSASAPTSEAQIISRGQSTAAASRYSVSGRPCKLPALYEGRMVNDCVNISGTLACQVSDNDWEACDLSRTGSMDSVVERVTVDGDPCLLPSTWKDQTVNDCIITQAGGEPVCQVASGEWKQCASLSADPQSETTPSIDPSPSNVSSIAASPPPPGARPPTVAVDGQTCELPLSYRGIDVDTCLSLAGDLYCWGSQSEGWVPCLPSTSLTGPAAGAHGRTTGASAFLVVPTNDRVTTDGQFCRLPYVSEGEVLDDCVDRNGVPSCVSASEEEEVWKECDLATVVGPRPRASLDGELFVANRTTVNGSACLLPAVQSGYMWFDCVDFGVSGQGTIFDACPTASGVWEVCAPVTGANYTMKFSADDVFERSVPGVPGQLCALQPGDTPLRECSTNNTCFPLPEMGGVADEQLRGLGFCNNDVTGGTFGTYKMLQEEGIPTPLAHFPLTDGKLRSTLLPSFNGSAFGDMAPPTWVQDEKFTSVVDCQHANRDALVLDSVPYGLDGSFAINLWIRRLPDSNISGDDFQYIYSHAGDSTAGGNLPNQVQIYLADASHPAYGLVRAIVKDDTDTNTLVYLDSDGQVNTNHVVGPRVNSTHTDVNDGRWHMITLSTFPNDTKGYSMFLDGREVGSLSPSSPGAGAPDEVPGGDAALMTSAITLCSRNDFDRNRFYDGSLAHLMLFNNALNSSQIAAIFSQYGGSNMSSSDLVQAFGATGDPSDSLAADPSEEGDGGGGGGLSGGAIAGIVIGSLVGAALLGMLVVLFVKRRRGRRFESFKDDAPHGVAGAAVVVGALPKPPGSPANGGLSRSNSSTIQLSHNNSFKLQKDLSMDPASPAPASRPPSSIGYPAAGNPFRSPIRLTRPPATSGTDLPLPPPLPPGPASEAAETASLGSRATTSFTEDVEMEAGSRSMLGFKRKPVRITVPDAPNGAGGQGAGQPTP